VLLSGEASNRAAALAEDTSQNVYVAGNTTSKAFPITPGALVSEASPGFLAKLNSDASLGWSTFLGPTNIPGGIVVDSAGQPVIAGAGPIPGVAQPAPNSIFVMRLDRSGSQIIASTYIPGSSAPAIPPGLPQPASTASLAAGPDGSLYLFAGSAVPVTPGSYNGPQPAAPCSSYWSAFEQGLNSTGNAFAARLTASDLHPVYIAMLRASCGIVHGPLAVDATGTAVLAMYASPGLALRNPLLAGTSGSAIARVSPDGAMLQFATYPDDGGIPGLALAADGSIYAGVTHGYNGLSGPSGALHIAIPGPPISLDGIANAFSGSAGPIAPGGLYTLTGTGFQPAAANLGVNQNLPESLNGVQVTFDGISAAILQTGPGIVTAVAPPPPKLLTGGKLPAFTVVQLTVNGAVSNTVLVPLAASAPGLMTRAFPALPQFQSGYPDAYALNSDGAVNDETHPAPRRLDRYALCHRHGLGQSAGRPRLHRGRGAVDTRRAGLDLLGPGQPAPTRLAPVACRRLDRPRSPLIRIRDPGSRERRGGQNRHAPARWRGPRPHRPAIQPLLRHRTCPRLQPGQCVHLVTML